MVAVIPAGPLPPVSFLAHDDVVAAGSRFYRVHSSRWSTAEFNPGFGRRSRFAFFGDPSVPVLYAAGTAEAAVAESLLHDVPAAGGSVMEESYADLVMGRVVAARGLRLAKLRGMGLRALHVEASDVTDTNASQYRRTVLWSAAAHAAGFDGVSWTSRRCNDAQAIVLFGDRCAGAVAVDPGYARIFRNRADLQWLIDLCDPLGISVEIPAAP